MKKSDWRVRRLFSASHVVAHAIWQRSRGRQPSMSYRDELNPRQALANAKAEIQLSRPCTRVTEQALRHRVAAEGINPKKVNVVSPHWNE